ncbi:restriction endonuclease [Pseudomonas sp. F01002]|uniref:restriction endonuclease n=1 Tax=Pseudomonas sp. F01002 TaxID=2555724 RepID=UPI00141AD4F9|nr:restriction endonuclease [Pseudomonas sp. F01002]
MNAAGFMHKYYDWAAFEIFIKELYEGDGNVLVERDVTEIDRYGARRQTDVKITHRARFNNFITLVECKRWKDPISRDRVDVLAASIEALGANKGAIFTTTGFEAGAIAYAKGKGIDLFLVRDLTAAEWGLPGREICLHLHINAAIFMNIKFDAMAIPLIKNPPTSLEIHVALNKEMALDPDLDLFSINTGQRGPNLVSILADAHEAILHRLGNSVGLLENGEDITLEIIAPCEIDLSQTEFRQLRLASAAVEVNKIGFALRCHINQSTIKIDRGIDLDFALMIESHVTDQRMVAHRKINSAEIAFEVTNTTTCPSDTDDDILQNGSLARVQCSPYVGIDTKATKTGLAEDILKIVVETEGAKPQLSLFVVKKQTH